MRVFLILIVLSVSALASEPGHLSIEVGEERRVSLPEPSSRVSIADPQVADVVVLQPKELLLIGKTPGQTSLMIWQAEHRVLQYRVEVAVDLSRLKRMMTLACPDETSWHLEAVDHDVVLMGRVTDPMSLHQLEALAKTWVRQSGKAGEVINLLQVESPQQVLLHVQVAEVSKSLLEQWGGKLNVGTANTGLMSDLTGTGGSNLGISVVSGLFSGGLHLSAQEGVIRTLAEPTLMAMSGQEATFLAGGKVFVPVSQSLASNTAITTLEEKEYGVALKFTPTVLRRGVIHLKVAPEVSELNSEGLGLSTNGGLNQAVFPMFSSRRASTTVELHEGESLVIGGLIQHTHNTSLERFPWLGDVPLLGLLFRNAERQRDDTELVFIVTPNLVTSDTAMPTLPTDNARAPNDQELFIEGKNEGTGPAMTVPEPRQALSPLTFDGEVLHSGLDRLLKPVAPGAVHEK